MIELTFRFEKDNVSQIITVQLSNVRQVRRADSPAPWDIDVKLMWGSKCLFNNPHSGADPLHAVELAARFAANYLRGRAEDEGGKLDPEIVPP